MNLRAVAWLLGCVSLIVAAFLLAPAAVALYYGESVGLWASLASALVSGAVGGALVRWNRGSRLTADGRPNYFRREGLAVVGLSWLVAGVLGALPYMFSGLLPSPVDAVFEAVSGFTTTGSTVLSGEQIDSLHETARAMGFWRSFTHWLGGFGIVMVFVVLFPTGGRSLFRSEIPGIAREAGHQRVRDSAITLMKIYVGLSAAEFVLLVLVGMGGFDAALHTFGTIATGGFSDYSTSVAWFASFKVELVIGVFMFVAGINFAYYDLVLRSGLRSGWRAIVGSAEVRMYSLLTFGSIVVIATVLWFWGGSNGLADSALPDYRSYGLALRDSFFSVISLVTSTGYGTADFDQWPQVCRVWLMVLCVVGACAGSTGGGVKVVRFIIVAKAALRGVRQFIRPRAVHMVRVDGVALEPAVVSSITGYFVLWVFVFLGGTVLLATYGMDLETASTAVVATLNNIGPGLAHVGPTQNFAAMPELVKVVLTVFMILGRLEFYAVVALFVPGFWKG
ncbi:MAG: TrkH family potassium uptake protein [Planctomycetes bacterium]|nr:TrkH family potassium uptake protein [Planctomycetota bacterium]